MIFLIQYDRAKGKIVDLQRFDDADRKTADTKRLALEIAKAGTASSIEVVILDAASEDALRKTHRRYFETLEELVEPASVKR